MTRTRAFALVGGLGAGAIVAAAFMFALTARAPAEGPAALTAEIGEGAPAAESSGGSQEGVQVHGHWVIEVRDSDGTLASRSEFDNSLQLAGEQTLSRVLSRESLVGEWTIRIYNNPFSLSPCEDATPDPAICEIKESATGSPNHFPTLTVTRIGEQVVLSGTATAQKDGAINIVGTLLARCDPATPTSCVESIFTSATIGSVPVTLGQGILVTLTLSFS